MSAQAVAVALAIHRPELSALRRQLQSVIEQDGVNVDIYAALAGDEPGRQELRGVLADAGVRIVDVNPGHGPRANFMAGLAAALLQSGAPHFAYCDQDDIWDRRKLAVCRDRLLQTGAALVHCDARIVNAEGEILAASLHGYERREEGRSQADHLVLNTVSGFTALFRRDVAALTVSLAEKASADFLHDHLTAVAAASLPGGVTRLADCLADYRQHDANAIGASRPSPLLGGWMLRPGAFRWRSRALFAARQELAGDLRVRDLACPETLRLFGLDRAGRRRCLAAWARQALAAVQHGQWRRFRTAIRLADGAWQARLS